MARFPSPNLTYIKPCPHRVRNNEAFIDAYMDETAPPEEAGQGVQGAPLCMLMTKEVGITVGTTPKTCALCQYASAEPNMDFINERIGSAYDGMVELSKLGFYQAADIENIMVRAYPFIKDHPKRLQHFKQALQAIVESKKLPLATVEKMVKDHMKELANEPVDPVAEGGGAGG